MYYNDRKQPRIWIYSCSTGHVHDVRLEVVERYNQEERGLVSRNQLVVGGDYPGRRAISRLSDFDSTIAVPVLVDDKRCPFDRSMESEPPPTVKIQPPLGSDTVDPATSPMKHCAKLQSEETTVPRSGRPSSPRFEFVVNPSTSLSETQTPDPVPSPPAHGVRVSEEDGVLHELEEPTTVRRPLPIPKEESMASWLSLLTSTKPCDDEVALREIRKITQIIPDDVRRLTYFVAPEAPDVYVTPSDTIGIEYADYQDLWMRALPMIETKISGEVHETLIDVGAEKSVCNAERNAKRIPSNRFGRISPPINCAIRWKSTDQGKIFQRFNFPLQVDLLTEDSATNQSKLLWVDVLVADDFECDDIVLGHPFLKKYLVAVTTTGDYLYFVDRATGRIYGHAVKRWVSVVERIDRSAKGEIKTNMSPGIRRKYYIFPPSGRPYPRLGGERYDRAPECAYPAFKKIYFECDVQVDPTGWRLPTKFRTRYVDEVMASGGTIRTGVEARGEERSPRARYPHGPPIYSPIH